ncbi:MAG: alpha-beta hydrolase superfamily lysophospholipase, partial [Paraglaciecola sp.]
VARLTKCKMRVLEGAKHELLMEQDQYRQVCLQATLDFFKADN